MNWNVFWRMWRVYGIADFDSGWAAVRTPWLSLEIGWNALDFYGKCWSGVRARYGHRKGWELKQGEFALLEADHTLSWNVEGRYPYLVARTK